MTAEIFRTKTIVICRFAGCDQRSAYNRLILKQLAHKKFIRTENVV